MKIYTVTFDTATLSPARIWVAPHSQFAVGVKVFVNGTEAEGAVTLKKDGAAIPAEESKVGGFTVFQTASGETGSAEYEISVAGLSQKMKLVQVTTDSTVFDVGGSGGDVPADVATKPWVESQISDFVDEDALTAYYTKGETNGLLSAKADATKQLPADVTAWVTTGWNDVSEDEQGTAWTKIESGFYDVSDYGDVEVSAQYVSPGWVTHPTPAWRARGVMNLFSECSDGKTLGVTLWDKSDADWFFEDSSTWESNIDGYISAYYEFDPAQVPEGSGNLLEHVPVSSVKLFAYVSRNMDQTAPYDLREITDEADSLGQPCQPEDIWHDAYGEVIPGFVEVSAVYGDEISSFVDGSTLNDRLGNYPTWDELTDSLTAYATTDSLTAFYEKSETSSATEIGTALAGKQPSGDYALTSQIPDVSGKVNNLSGVANVRKISQADYDALSAGGTADANTLYVIV